MRVAPELGGRAAFDVAHALVEATMKVYGRLDALAGNGAKCPT